MRGGEGTLRRGGRRWEGWRRGEEGAGGRRGEKDQRKAREKLSRESNRRELYKLVLMVFPLFFLLHEHLYLTMCNVFTLHA